MVYEDPALDASYPPPNEAQASSAGIAPFLPVQFLLSASCEGEHLTSQLEVAFAGLTEPEAWTKRLAEREMRPQDA